MTKRNRLKIAVIPSGARKLNCSLPYYHGIFRRVHLFSSHAKPFRNLPCQSRVGCKQREIDP